MKQEVNVAQNAQTKRTWKNLIYNLIALKEVCKDSLSFSIPQENDKKSGFHEEIRKNYHEEDNYEENHQDCGQEGCGGGDRSVR